MATIGTEALANEAQLERDLQRMMRKAPERMRTGMYKIGRVVEKRAQAYAPISPTLAMIEANLSRGAVKRNAKTNITINRDGTISIGASTLHSRRRTGKRAIKEFGKEGKGVNPGKLQENTKVQGIGANESQAYVDIGVALNSSAGKYAHYIHDQGPHGTGKWKKRGIGTRIKGPKAGDKFINRAVADTTGEQLTILRATLDKWFADGGF